MFTADQIVLYAALAVGVLLAVEGVYQLAVDMRSGPRAQINRRLRMLAEDSADPRRVLQSLLREVLPHFPCRRCGVTRHAGRGRGGVRIPPARTSSA
jgi:hypothetical protein